MRKRYLCLIKIEINQTFFKTETTLNRDKMQVCCKSVAIWDKKHWDWGAIALLLQEKSSGFTLEEDRDRKIGKWWLPTNCKE